MRELANRVRIELVDTCKGFFSDRFLIVSKEESTELTSLKEILAVVLWLRHGEQVLMQVATVLLRRVEFEL